MYTRLLNTPNGNSFFVFGPRGTGKTTWTKKTFPSALYLDLLESELFNDLLANPGRLENLIPKGFNGRIIIDEVQRVPELLNEVHRLIENRGNRFILTGSSPRKLRKRGHNLLAGRALTLYMHQLTAAELGKDFDLNRSLLYGHMPSAVSGKGPKAYLESYISTYLQEEILQEGLTRNLGAFSRFLESASFSQGALLNISSVARECSIERKTVESYFSILEDLLIAYRVPVFTKKAKRRMLSHPKFYFFDVGVYRTLRPMGPLDTPEMVQGTSVETLVFQELNAVNSYMGSRYKIFYWRTSNNVEVDFVLYGDKGIKAIEIKSAAKVSSSMLSGLRAFLKDYPGAEAYCVYGGKRRMREGNIEIISIEDFLKTLPEFLS